MSITDQNAVMDALVRHGTYLHRASSAVVNEIIRHLDRSSAEMVSELRDRLENLTPAEAAAFAAGRITTSRLKGIENLIARFVEEFGELLDSAFMPTARNLIEYENGFTAEMLSRAGIEGAVPKASEAWKAVLATPVAGSTIQVMLDEIPRNLEKRVRSTIRQGLADGQSASDIATAIRGTAALRRKDGVLQTTRNAIDRTVRTARSVVSAQAAAQTYQALDVEEVVWTATLDGRICKTCADRDGVVYRADKPHPMPPAHPNCRCFLAPKLADDAVGKRPYVRAEKVKGEFRSIGRMTKKQRREAGLEVGQVSASTRFPTWFANQDAAFQREWLGPKRYELYRKGGYSLDRFVDPRGAELTIDQLRQKDRETFDRLFSA